MNKKDSKYDIFIKVFKKAYPDYSPQTFYEKAQALWRKLKAKPEELDAKINELRVKGIQNNNRLGVEYFFRKQQQNQDAGLPTSSQSSSTSEVPQAEASTADESTRQASEVDESSQVQHDETTEQPESVLINENDSQSPDVPTSSTKVRQTPAQTQLQAELNDLNKNIASLVQVRTSIGLGSEQTKKLKEIQEQKKVIEKKLQRNKNLVKSQQKFRKRKQENLEKLAAEYPEAAAKVKNLGKVQFKPGKPSIEASIEDSNPNLHSLILSIVQPDSAADERRRTETYNCVKSLDGLKKALEEIGFTITRTALYYRLLPKNSRHIDGKRHVHTVPVRLCRPQSDLRKSHPDAHFAMASVKYARELCTMFDQSNVFFLSQDDKARVPLGIPISKKQTALLMHVEYKVKLPDHDFPIGKRHKLIPSIYAACMKKDDGELCYSGPTYAAVRSGKHDTSSAGSHSEDFDRLVNLTEFSKAAKKDDRVKPLVFVSVDGGPDESPKNEQALATWSSIFDRYKLDALFVFTHAAGYSATTKSKGEWHPFQRQHQELCYHSTHSAHILTTTTRQSTRTWKGKISKLLGRFLARFGQRQ